MGAARADPGAAAPISWTRMSMAGVLAYRPDRSRAKLIFQTKPGSYNTEASSRSSPNCVGTCADPSR
ncbi:hypothetical protein [Dactylosporangium darangshiense]|uniref:Uncharacterized protein n=1 Tax=Dactylosporangium darangshiense TaxID=579108 RepID=A0ABP8DUX1_9ACTN